MKESCAFNKMCERKHCLKDVMFSFFIPFTHLSFSLSSSGTMLTAHLRSPSSARSTSAGAASCSVRMPSVALSRGCAGSTCVCAVSCSPCVTGLSQSRAASEPAVCAVPAPHWIAWRLGQLENRDEGLRKTPIRNSGLK